MQVARELVRSVPTSSVFSLAATNCIMHKIICLSCTSFLTQGGPPPPPPPPVASSSAPPPPPPSKPAQNLNLPTVDSGRSNLLASIRAGVQLKTVS